MIGRPGVGLFIRLFSCRGPLARGVRAAVVGGTEFGRVFGSAAFVRAVVLRPLFTLYLSCQRHAGGPQKETLTEPSSFESG